MLMENYSIQLTELCRFFHVVLNFLHNSLIAIYVSNMIAFYLYTSHHFAFLLLHALSLHIQASASTLSISSLLISMSFHHPFISYRLFFRLQSPTSKPPTLSLPSLSFLFRYMYHNCLCYAVQVTNLVRFGERCC